MEIANSVISGTIAAILGGSLLYKLQQPEALRRNILFGQRNVQALLFAKNQKPIGGLFYLSPDEIQQVTDFFDSLEEASEYLLGFPLITKKMRRLKKLVITMHRDFLGQDGMLRVNYGNSKSSNPQNYTAIERLIDKWDFRTRLYLPIGGILFGFATFTFFFL